MASGAKPSRPTLAPGSIRCARDDDNGIVRATIPAEGKGEVAVAQPFRMFHISGAEAWIRPVTFVRSAVAERYWPSGT